MGTVSSVRTAEAPGPAARLAAHVAGQQGFLRPKGWTGTQAETRPPCLLWGVETSETDQQGWPSVRMRRKQSSHVTACQKCLLESVCVTFSFTGAWNLTLKNHHKWVSFSRQVEKETLHEDLATGGISKKAGGDSPMAD